jgi:hypothetical protein
MISNNNN